MDVVLALLLGENLLEYGGGPGGGGQKIGADGRVADDGKRFEAMDVVLALLLGENLLEWGRGLEEGGQRKGPEPRVADDGKRF